MAITKLRAIGVVVVLLVTSLAHAQVKSEWAAAPDPLPKPAKIAATFNFVVPTRFPFGDATASPQNPTIVAFNTNNIQTHDWETWDLSTRKRIGGAKDTTLEIGVPSPDGLYLLGATSIHNRGVAEIWSLQQNGKLLHKLTNAQGGDFVPLGFAVNDQVVTMHSVGFKHVLTAWNLKTGQKAWEFETDRWLLANAAISPGGRFLAYPSKGDVIKLHDLSTNEPAGELPPATGNDPNARPDNNLQAIAFSPDGAVVAARYQFTGNRVGVWDLSNGKSLLDVKISEGPNPNRLGPSLQWLSDSGGFVVGLSVFDRQSGGQVHTLPAPDPTEAYRQVLSFGTLLYVPKPQQNRIAARTVALPKTDIDKALASVRAGGKSVDVGLPPLSKADWSTVKELSDKAELPKGPLPPDPAAKFTKKLAPVISFRKINDPDGQTEQAVSGVYFSSPSLALALVPHDIGPRMRTFTIGQPLQKVWADRVDLATGKVLATYDFPNVARVLDMNADATHAAVALADRIDLYALTPALKHVVGFRPYEKEEGDGRFVRWARLLDAEHVLTLNHVGNIHTGARLVLWKFPECKAVYSLRVAGWATPGLSPNRKHAAVPVEGGMLLMDPRTANVHGMLPKRGNAWAIPSFSLDGALLAAADQIGQTTTLRVWDLRKPSQPEWVIGLPSQRGNVFTIDWTSPGFLLVNELLVDLDKQMIVWEYDAPSAQSNHADVRDVDESTWFLSPSGGLKLVSTTLPHDEARKTLAALKPDDYALRPGMKVSLELRTATGDAEVEKKLATELKQRLTANGFTIADGQPLKLVTQVTLRGGKELEYNLFGRFEKQKATTTEYDARIAFEQDGQTVWEAKSTGSNASFFVQMKQGETAQDVINRSIPQLGVQLFTSVPLPKYAPKPGAGVGFGRSRLTPKGAEPAPPTEKAAR